MPGSRFLLDTNIVIAFFAGDAAVTAKLSQTAEVFVPIVVVGELLFGARKSSRVTENIARVNDLAAAATIVPCDLATAGVYGEV
jgi:tRNA(fMet)-specific endonuclease VapC